MRILISGGGSGGHVFPAIAIADMLKSKMPEATIRFIGALGKIEMEKVPKAGYPIDGLWISGFHRQLTWRNLMFPIKLLSSLWKAGRLLRRFQPDVVIGVGGFASGPTLQVATRRAIPTLIQEQNSFPGITNRLLAGKVDRICVAYEGMDRFFPAEKIVLTGNPVRDAIRFSKVTRVEGLHHFGLDPQRKTIFVFGGSLGARSINRAMADQTELLQSQADTVQVLWQCGSLYWDTYQDSATARLPNVHIHPFIDRMDLAYALADVVVGRAGALTISELCVAGKAVVLIPSPNVAEDHQTKNAEALVLKKAAVLVKDAEAPAEVIRQPLAILADPARKAELEKNIKQLAVPNAGEQIAAEVLALLKR